MDKPYQRLLTAIIGIPLLFLICYLGEPWFLLLVLTLILIAQVELLRVFEKKRYTVNGWLIISSSLLLAISAYIGYLYMNIMFTVIVVLVLVIDLKQEALNEVIHRLAISMFVIIYIGWFLSHAILLRDIGENSSIRVYAETAQGLKDAGFFYIIFVFSSTFLNDTGAYYIGKWKGSRKLSPNISPGKTVEGTVAGIITAIIGGEIVNLIFKSPLPLHWVFILSVIIAGMAIFGDLIESMIKRSVGIKDTGSILPGHGGILDRFDSLILVFPVSYYLILLHYYLNGVMIL